MKTLTPPLIKFGLVAILGTTGFRVALSTFLTEGHFNFIIPLSILFTIAMFMAGRYFGKKDHEYLPIYDVGFRFHLVTFLQFHVVSYTWALFGYPSKLENIGVLHNTLIFWSILLGFHTYYYVQAKKNSIRHINKEDLFD